jgi:hypothetical protein
MIKETDVRIIKCENRNQHVAGNLFSFLWHW